MRERKKEIEEAIMQLHVCPLTPAGSSAALALTVLALAEMAGLFLLNLLFWRGWNWIARRDGG